VPPLQHPPRPPRPFVSATVSRDPGGGGGGVTLGLSDSQRYDLRRFSDLSPDALTFSISSASVSRRVTHDSESSLYLFSGQTPVSSGDLRRLIPQTLLSLRVRSPFVDFHGDFLRITLPPGAAGTSGLDDLTAAAFNDKATSVMLADRWRNGVQEETVSAANTFTAGWDAAFMAVIPIAQVLLGGGVAISKIQDPVFSWIAFPPPSQALPTNYTYMLAAQWFVFNAWGIGVNAWLMFYLRLGRDGNGKVELNVLDMDYYVWPGTGQGQLMNALDGAKNGIMSALQAVSTLVLGNVKGTVCDDVYLLPGTQPDIRAATNASAQGSALNDVTIILENPR
jgi:hypothetical protein